MKTESALQAHNEYVYISMTLKKEVKMYLEIVTVQ